jgi:hypothetical protein
VVKTIPFGLQSRPKSKKLQAALLLIKSGIYTEGYANINSLHIAFIFYAKNKNLRKSLKEIAENAILF